MIALPTPATETYTAHATAIPAVQFNTVYLTPCTTVPSISFGSASDKRYSLGIYGVAYFWLAVTLVLLLLALIYWLAGTTVKGVSP